MNAHEENHSQNALEILCLQFHSSDKSYKTAGMNNNGASRESYQQLQQRLRPSLHMQTDTPIDEGYHVQ